MRSAAPGVRSGVRASTRLLLAMAFALSACDDEVVSRDASASDAASTVLPADGGGGDTVDAGTADGGLTVTCVPPSAPVRISAQSPGVFIGADESFAYFFAAWNDMGAGSFVRHPLTGGEPTVLARVDEPVEGTSLGDGMIVFLTAGSSDERLWTLPVAGGTPNRLPNAVARYSQPVVAGGYVYLTNSSGDMQTTIHRIPLAGGEGNVVASAVMAAGPVVVSDGSVYWANRYGNAGGLRGISTALATGSPITTLVTDAEVGEMIAVAKDEIVYTSGSTVRAVPRLGGASRLVSRDDFRVTTLFTVGETAVWQNVARGANAPDARAADLAGGDSRLLFNGRLAGADACSIFADLPNEQGVRAFWRVPIR